MIAIDEVSKLTLGTAQFGLSYGVANQQGQVSRSEIQSILKGAKERGVVTLDTAISYGDSEKNLGINDLEGFSIVSKLPEIPTNCYNITAWIKQQIQASLRRLRVESLDGLLLHRPLQLLQPYGHEIYKAMLELKEMGVIKKIGISVYNPDELHKLIAEFYFDIVQAPMNIIDRRFEVSGCLKLLKDMGTEVHIRSAFLQGVLLMTVDQIPNYFNPWKEILKSYHRWLDENGITSLQACISYLNQNPNIDRIIVGVDNLQQLKEIITVANGPIQNYPLFLSSVDEDFINPSRWKL